MPISLPKHLVKKIVLSHGIIPKSFRHRLLRRMIHLPQAPPGITYEIARTREDLDAAFSLVYQAYRREGITPYDPSQRRITLFHALPSTTTLVAKKGPRVVATVSLIKDGELGVPSDTLTDLNSFRRPGKRMAEISSLALRPDLHGQAAGVMFYLTKYMIRYSREYFGVDRYIISVHPGRLPLYQGLFLFTPLTGVRVRSHSFANNAPAVTAVRNLATAAADFHKVYKDAPGHRNLYRFLFRSSGKREELAMKFPSRRSATILDPVMTPELLSYFFRQKTDIFTSADPRQIKKLRQIYPGEIFSKALPDSKPPSKSFLI